MAENTKVAESKRDFGLLLSDKLDLVKDGLPANFNKTRFVQNCIAFLNEDAEKYKKFSKELILANLVRASYLGLDYMSKECYLVPFKGKLTFMTSYTGSMKLAKRYSTRPILDLYAKVIRDGDTFEESIVDGKPSVNFKPKFLNDGEIIGAFAVVIYKDGGTGYEVMSKADIENTRKHSNSPNSPAWTSYYSEMAKKTVLRRLCKSIDLEFENATQQGIFNEEAAIETDPVKENEIIVEAEANTVDFEEFDADESGDPK